MTLKTSIEKAQQDLSTLISTKHAAITYDHDIIPIIDPIIASLRSTHPNDWPIVTTINKPIDVYIEALARMLYLAYRGADTIIDYPSHCIVNVLLRHPFMINILHARRNIDEWRAYTIELRDEVIKLYGNVNSSSDIGELLKLIDADSGIMNDASAIHMFNYLCGFTFTPDAVGQPQRKILNIIAYADATSKNLRGGDVNEFADDTDSPTDGIVDGTVTDRTSVVVTDGINVATPETPFTVRRRHRLHLHRDSSPLSPCDLFDLFGTPSLPTLERKPSRSTSRRKSSQSTSSRKPSQQSHSSRSSRRVTVRSSRPLAKVSSTSYIPHYSFSGSPESTIFIIVNLMYNVRNPQSNIIYRQVPRFREKILNINTIKFFEPFTRPSENPDSLAAMAAVSGPVTIVNSRFEILKDMPSKFARAYVLLSYNDSTSLKLCHYTLARYGRNGYLSQEDAIDFICMRPLRPVKARDVMNHLRESMYDYLIEPQPDVESLKRQYARVMIMARDAFSSVNKSVYADRFIEAVRSSDLMGEVFNERELPMLKVYLSKVETLEPYDVQTVMDYVLSYLYPNLLTESSTM